MLTLSLPKDVIRSHATRHASEEDQKTFVKGAEAATRLLETLQARDLEELFAHARWGAAGGAGKKD
jgi:hypothetical protein